MSEKKAGLFSRITRSLVPFETFRRFMGEQRRIHRQIEDASSVLDIKPKRLKAGEGLDRMLAVWRILPEDVILVIRARRRNAILFFVAGILAILVIPSFTSGGFSVAQTIATVQMAIIGTLMLYIAGVSWWRAECLRRQRYQTFLDFWFGDFLFRKKKGEG